MKSDTLQSLHPPAAAPDNLTTADYSATPTGNVPPLIGGYMQGGTEKGKKVPVWYHCTQCERKFKFKSALKV